VAPALEALRAAAAEIEAIATDAVPMLV